jgi:hypothetical protein
VKPFTSKCGNPHACIGHRKIVFQECYERVTRVSQFE